jgi:hypothetical protein
MTSRGQIPARSREPEGVARPSACQGTPPGKETEMHLDTTFHDIEMDVGDGPWERWYDACQDALGLNLDQDDNTAGYSVDGAYQWFRNGCTVAAYVQLVRTRRARRGLGEPSAEETAEYLRVRGR